MPLPSDELMKYLETDDLEISQSRMFSDDYKEIVFYVWYNNKKPTPTKLFDLIPEPETNNGIKPARMTLSNWINGMFAERASKLDEGVRNTLDTAVIQAKIEMLKRHVETSKEMQNIGIEWLKAHKDELTGASAVRLATEGMRIERESLGIPGALLRMSEKSDDELLEELRQLIEESPVEFEEKDD